MLRQIIEQTNKQKDHKSAELGFPIQFPQSTMQSTVVFNPMCENFLANGVEIKGSIFFSKNLIIDGRIEGEVISDGCLKVGENALIRGEVKTRSVIIFGKVEGDVTVQERCEIKTNAILVGDISAGTLAIEEGATFMGQSFVGKKADSQPKKPSWRP